MSYFVMYILYSFLKTVVPMNDVKISFRDRDSLYLFHLRLDSA